MTEAVLDASAVLALLRSEPGADIVERALAKDVCAISAVNVAEVATKLFDEGMPSHATESMLDSLGVDIRPFDYESALASAALRASTRARGLSLGDRACLALAQSLDLPVITADRAWAGLSLGITIVVARE